MEIIGAVEDGGSDRKDLVEHSNKYNLKLSDTLDRLASKSKPDYQPPEKEKRQLKILCQALKAELRRELQLAKEPETSIYSPLEK